MNGSQYITPPPDLPPFVYKRSATSLKGLISWATKEHRERLKYCAKRGYFREWTRLHNDYSPMRVLAEMDGLRKVLSMITQEVWDQLTMRERVFIRRAFELRGLLSREDFS
jgi:hypothetical protein